MKNKHLSSSHMVFIKRSSFVAGALFAAPQVIRSQRLGNNARAAEIQDGPRCLVCEFS